MDENQMQDNANKSIWKKCSACKKNILLGSMYYECNVSTCTSERTGYVFCNVACWEIHLPAAKHRSAGAVERWAPKSIESRKIIINSNGTAHSTQSANSNSMSNEVLVVVSKMKQYIKEKSEYSTSEDVNHILSNMIRIACDRAIDKARASGRKTVMAKDFSF